MHLTGVSRDDGFTINFEQPPASARVVSTDVPPEPSGVSNFDLPYTRLNVASASARILPDATETSVESYFAAGGRRWTRSDRQPSIQLPPIRRVTAF